MAPPTAEDLKKGTAAVEKAKSARAKTQRERDYIGAMEVFYKDSDKVLHRERALNEATGVCTLEVSPHVSPAARFKQHERRRYRR